MPETPRSRRKRTASKRGPASREQRLRFERFERFGPDDRALAGIARSVPRHPVVRRHLADTRNRLLSIDLLDPLGRAKPREAVAPDAYGATFYDYTNNRGLYRTASCPTASAFRSREPAPSRCPARRRSSTPSASSGRIRISAPAWERDVSSPPAVRRSATVSRRSPRRTGRASTPGGTGSR